MPIRLALVGCGAIAERFHAPALKRRRPDLPALHLVDPSATRRETLAAAVGGGSPAADLRDVLPLVDAVLLTVPHHLHHAMATACLEAGVHVLSEKPLAASVQDARSLVATAAAADRVLAVNNTRRLYPAHQRVATLLREGAVGTIHRIRFEDGDKFDWPLASPSLFGPRAGGKGLLLDIGAHVVDLVCWWMGGEPQIAAYADDAMGGTEASVAIELRRDACTADIRLSWLAKLANGFVIEGERGRLEGGIYDWNTVTLVESGRRRVLREDGPATYADFAHPLLDNFLEAVQGRAAPLVTGADVLPSLAVIDACYARRTRLPMPWFDAWTRWSA